MIVKKITYHESNQRIDNFIVSNFCKIPKSLLYKMVRVGKIKINKKKIKPYYKLQIGDILYLPNCFCQKKNKNISLNEKFKKYLLSCILHEDKHLLIINKPSGIAVHGGSGLKYGIIESFRILKPESKFLELIHRLDRNTSGILMLAKKKSALRSIHQQFRNQVIKKTYVALTHGNFLKDKIVVNQSLIKKKKPCGKNIVTINTNGKKSISIFKVQKKHNFTTVVSITPKTGRTHQIRVHASYIGHPILFDHEYGNKKLDYKINKNHMLEKILLHAKNITFFHPKNHKRCTINAPLDNRFKKYI